jgi:hypothetical protein
MVTTLEVLVALFIAYSFLGWIIESGFKTIRRQQGFVNSGLLYGPVVPIYGCGALLHDFFLYDWRTSKGRHHPSRHPGVALSNAHARFALNPVEEDIILTHMWPVAKPFYSFKESFLVSSIDKLVSTKEAAKMLKNAAFESGAKA